MKSWDEIKAWRRETRAKLLARRVAVRREERERVGAIVAALLAERVPELRTGCIGFCWPFKGEMDFRRFVGDAVAGGASAALPVVVERGQPLEFWAWRPRTKLQRGIWGIPTPAVRHVAQPNVLLVPLIGFDSAGYRLGYGGGYYDRTLAAAASKPLAIGIGYELGRLETIHPQPHDIAMDAIVTENGFAWVAGGARSAAKPNLARSGNGSAAGLLDLLRQLLEGERAGARGVAVMSLLAKDGRSRAALGAIARDEARFCAMLSRHITRLGGEPSAATGAFYDKLLAIEDTRRRLDFLDRGQGWVVDKLREALPAIDDPALHADLLDMLETHERNIARSATLR